MKSNTAPASAPESKRSLLGRAVGGLGSVGRYVKQKAVAFCAALGFAYASATSALAQVTGDVPVDIEQAAADVQATFVLVSGIIVGVVLFFTAVRFIRRIK